jgi:hypothetical protein
MDGINTGTTKKSAWPPCWIFQLGNLKLNCEMEFTGVIFRRTSIKITSRDSAVGMSGPESEFESQ